MRNYRLRFAIPLVLVLLLPLALYVMMPGSALGQATISTGSISGTVMDPSGAVFPGAKVVITNKATGQTIERVTSSAGVYNVGGLQPGTYVVRTEAKGFKSQEATVVVQVGIPQTVNVTMLIGSEEQTVEVSASSIAVNTEQATVSGVLGAQQIENLPVNGRNFLDLAQLEPGVQIQDGGTFDPTKNGFSSVSFGGKAGRTARITVDGIDISDENVGTTTQNVSAGTISEFQLSQSTLDLSTELTSSGSVNVVTKSGTNAIHGEGFYGLRDKRWGFAHFAGDCNGVTCNDGYYQRNQYGVSLGGPAVKNKLFWFLNAERAKQDQLVPVIGRYSTAGYKSPFRDTTLFGRLDWQATDKVKIFYKFNYNWNKATRSDAATFQPFANKNNTPSHGIGMDFNAGTWTHTLRYGYVYFSNQIADAVMNDPGLYDPVREWGIAARVGGLNTPNRFGTNRLVPQQTFQRNNQIKYDASKLFGNHLIRFGFDYNHIAGGGQAAFYTTPELRANAGDAIGDLSDPLNHTVNGFVVANGIGFATEKPAFGLPGGGLLDNRIGFYIGDAWKMRKNFTLSYGLRYGRDTGRSPSDLPAITCDQINADSFPELPCTGSTDLMGQWGPQFAGRVKQPSGNWGPQVGVAWDPTSSGKTVIRAGGGIYYENNVWNNILFDRGLRLREGLFNFVQGGTNYCGPSTAVLAAGVGAITHFPYNGGTPTINETICGKTVREAAPALAALQGYLIGAQAAAGAQANPQFIGESLGLTNMLAPNYKTPYSYQMNIGIQREILPNMIFSADLVRNVSLRFLVQYDQNLVGAAKYLDRGAAQAAITTTLANCGIGSLGELGTNCAHNPVDPTDAEWEPRPLIINDFADNGLDAAPGGFPGSAIGMNFAFPGKNPLLGNGLFLVPEGRSTYTGLQMKLQHTVNQPVRGLSSMSYQVSYAFSRLNSRIGTDQDFAGQTFDSINPGRYYGPSALDRTHQLSFGGSFQIHRGPMFSLIAHVFSPLSATPRLLGVGGSGEIFRSDVTGDGTVADIVPGGNIGVFGRDYNGGDINNLIDNYNARYAGQLTPAGQALVSAGLFTADQLASLGAVTETLGHAPGDQIGFGWLKTFDVRLQWPIKLGERFSLRPSLSIFNVFNQANINAGFVGPSNSTLVGNLDPTDASIMGVGRSSFTSQGDYLKAIAPLRTGVGTGVNTMGAPRQMEFGLKLVF